jgi:2,4-dienoyl-CoA reductase-like NADH-dependent reductase (Old Yellow Enzyme family)
LIDWHREFTRGGVGMTTLAYCSVASEGRTFKHQIWMRDEALPGLRRFTDAMRADGARVSIQLGHAGWFANPHATKTKPLGPSRTFSAHAQTFSRAMTEEDLDRALRQFESAATLAVEAGFDALEVHVGHGYLLSQFLSPYNNRRKDRWGGSLENRARFPRAAIAAVRRAAGPSVAVYPKLNMEDGFRGGMTLDEGIQVARWIEQDGHCDALQLTGGHTTKTPMFLMRGDVPLREMIANERNHVRRWGMRLFAPFMIQEYRFTEAFFMESAKRFRATVTMPIMLLGGITKLATMREAMSAGFEFVAMGRGLIRDPDLVNRMIAGELSASRCIPCNRCVAEMERSGTRCVYRDDAVRDRLQAG